MAGRAAAMRSDTRLRGAVWFALQFLFLASCGNEGGDVEEGSSRSRDSLVVCFCVYAPHVFLRKGHAAGVLDLLHLQELDVTEFNHYFTGYDVELVTALTTGLMEREPSVVGSSSFRFKLISTATEPRFFEGLYSIRTGQCDLGLGAFFSTTARTHCECPEVDEGGQPEGANVCCLDFSDPYERDGFSLVTKMVMEESHFLQSMISQFRLSHLTLVCFLVLAVYLSGHLVWLVERRTNSAMFPTAYLDGVDDGLWWSVTTMTTVGYGDKAPVTAVGRCLGFLWMIVGLVIFGILNAVLTSALTSANVKDALLRPQYASQTEALVNAHELFPICTPDTYHKALLLGYGVQADDIRMESIETCYKLLNASTTPPSRATHVGSIMYNRRYFITDALPSVYRVVHHSTDDPPPLTTISPGVVVNAVTSISRIALAFPKGSLLTELINEGLRELEEGRTVFSSVADAYRGGWTLEECRGIFMGDSLNPFQPLHVEYPNLPSKQALMSWPVDVFIIAVTIAATVVFLVVQIVGQWRLSHKEGRQVQPRDEEIASGFHNLPSGSLGKNVNRLEYDVAELNKTMQALLLSHRQLHGLLEARTALHSEHSPQLSAS